MHIFTSIAPEDADDISSKYKETWKWCIRCGILKLGHKYFRQGSEQKKNLKAITRKQVPACKVS